MVRKLGATEWGEAAAQPGGELRDHSVMGASIDCQVEGLICVRIGLRIAGADQFRHAVL